MRNWNTKRSCQSECLVTRHAPAPDSQPRWPHQITKKLLRLPQNSSRVRLGLKRGFSSVCSSRSFAGLDNLPSEILFLLTEIQHIDTRSQGIIPQATSSLQFTSHNSFQTFSKRLLKKPRDTFAIPVGPLLGLHRTQKKFRRPSKNNTHKSNNWQTRSSSLHKGLLTSSQEHVLNWSMIYRKCLFSRVKIPLPFQFQPPPVCLFHGVAPSKRSKRP